MTETPAPTPEHELCENKRAALDEIIAAHRHRPGALMVILNESQKDRKSTRLNSSHRL